MSNRNRYLVVELLEERALLNAAPVLCLPQTSFAVVKTSTLSVLVSATDKDRGETLTFSLVGAPAGASISTTQLSCGSGSAAIGTLSWTPTEDQGPACYSFAVVATDNGSPVRSASKTINVNTLAVGQVGNDLWIVGTSTNKGTATNPGDDVVSISSTNYQNKVSVAINGSTCNFTVPSCGQIVTKLFGGNDHVTINEAAGTARIGPPISVDGGTGINTLTVNGTQGPDALTITGYTVSLAGAGTITYANVQTLLVNGLGGNDTFAMTGINASTATTLDGGSDTDSFSGTFAADFSGSLTLSNMESATMSVTGTVTAGSTITGTNFTNLAIGTLAGTLLAQGGSITGANITNIAAQGLLEATETVTASAGVISQATIGTVAGSVLAGSIASCNFGTIAAGGSVTAQGQGTTSNVNIGTLSGSFTAPEDGTPGSGKMSDTTINEIGATGLVSTGSISGMSVGTTDAGSLIIAAGQGTTSNVNIGTLNGSFTAPEDGSPGSGIMTDTTIDKIGATGEVSTGSISGMSVGTTDAGSLIIAAGFGIIDHLTINQHAGTVSAVKDNTPGSGSLTNTAIGTLAITGIINADTADKLSIATDTGTINITNTLGNFAAGTLVGTANLSAGHFQVVTAQHAGPVVHFIETAVTRTIAVAPHVTGGGVPDFSFYYDGTVSGNPSVVVNLNAVTSGSFDLAVTTSVATNGGAGFDLAGVYSAGNVQTGIHNLVVGGNLLLGSVPAGAVAFLGLPATTTGGVQLPQDILAVAVAGTLPAASIIARSVPALAAHSFAGVTADNASYLDAKVPLAAGTGLSKANDTFEMFFSEAGDVAQFLVTGNVTSFDSKKMLFADIVTDNAPVTAQDTLIPAGLSTTVDSVAFTGQGASLTTAQQILSMISDIGGSIGDLNLSSPCGLANVTADSIIGSIEVSNGAINGVVKTTVGDLGRAFVDINGMITGVTTIHAAGGLNGKILAKGNLVSQIKLQCGLNGVVATDGDIGIIQTIGGAAQLSQGGSLIRFGGIVVAAGGVNGQIIALGNAFGDIKITGDLSGRIAVKGNQGEFGLASFRYGILGNVSICGGIRSTGAIVSSGLIGDDGANNTNNDMYGTHLTASGSVLGIIAAGEDINFGNSDGDNDSRFAWTCGQNRASIFENATGVNLAAINAIFTNNGNLLDVLDPAQLTLIVQDLLALKVSSGKLTGTTP
jgi:hypothetical protein